MTDLWGARGCGPWSEAFRAYPSVIAGQGSDLLLRRDPWYREELPGLIGSRQQPYLTREELVGVVEWKMARGVWRGRNLGLARANGREDVEAASGEAFAAVPEPRRPLDLLGKLKGVGPATASAVLAAFRPDLYPFFDEVVAAQVPGLRPGEFTLKEYLAYASALRERAEKLRAECPERAWTANDVGMALWAAAGGKAP